MKFILPTQFYQSYFKVPIFTNNQRSRQAHILRGTFSVKTKRTSCLHKLKNYSQHILWTFWKIHGFRSFQKGQNLIWHIFFGTQNFSWTKFSSGKSFVPKSKIRQSCRSKIHLIRYLHLLKNIWDKFTKISKLGLSMGRLIGEFLLIYWLRCQNVSFGWPTTNWSLISVTSEVFLKFSNVLRC